MCFENLTQVISLFSTQDVISCAADTEAGSTYVFQCPIHTYIHTSVISNNHEIIQRILIVSNCL